MGGMRFHMAYAMANSAMMIRLLFFAFREA